MLFEKTGLMAGRKKIPDEVKVVKGTFQKCRRSALVKSVQVVKIPAPPKDWSKDAKKVYKIAAQQLRLYRLLTPENLTQLSAYAAEMGKYIELEREVRSEGYLVEMSLPFGVINVANPKLKIAAAALKNATRLATEFGLTPASLMRMGSVTKNDDDEYEHFLNNG